MENPALKNELIALEKKYWKAMEEHDLDTALSLTDFPAMIAGPQGMAVVDKETYSRMFESHKGSTMRMEFTKEPEVRMLNDDTAAVAYEVKSDMKVEGKDTTLHAVDTSTWIRKDGRWVCALHTETPLAKQ